MGWFNKNRLNTEHDLNESNRKVEIKAHKKATKQEINNVRKANEALNDLFVRNNFTLTIYLASGGKHEEMVTKVTGEKKKTWERKPKLGENK